MERHWLERQDVFTGFVHWFNLFLESARRTYRAKLTVGVYDDIHSVGDACCYTTNGGDEGSCLKFTADADGSSVGRHTSITDKDVAAAGGEVEAGQIAERDVAATG